MTRLHEWISDIFTRFRKFKPGVFYDEPMRLTEIILKDTGIVWCPLNKEGGHFVDLGYDFAGNLVGVKVWADVRTRDGWYVAKWGALGEQAPQEDK